VKPWLWWPLMMCVAFILNTGLRFFVLDPAHVPEGAQFFCGAVLGLGVGWVWTDTVPKKEVNR